MYNKETAQNFNIGALPYNDEYFHSKEYLVFEKEEIKILNVSKISIIERFKKTTSKAPSFSDKIKKIEIFNNSSLQTIRKNKLIEEISSFKFLEQNWDGYGAIPLEVKTSNNALILIDKIEDIIFCKVDNFYPNPHGTITFEWENNIFFLFY